jgi:hypothetical protein
MRTFKLIGVLACVSALSAIAVTPAIAEVLPGKAGTTITGGSEKATLQVKGGASITCPKSTSSGEVLGTSGLLINISFGIGCTTAGLPVNSLGDASGVILVHAEVSLCFGFPFLRIKILPLHLEVPSTKLLLTIEGTVLGVVEEKVSKTTFPLTITQKEGKNTEEKCGKETLILSTSTDGGAFVQSGEEAKNASLTFGVAEEFM